MARAADHGLLLAAQQVAQAIDVFGVGGAEVRFGVGQDHPAHPAAAAIVKEGGNSGGSYGPVQELLKYYSHGGSSNIHLKAAAVKPPFMAVANEGP